MRRTDNARSAVTMCDPCAATVFSPDESAYSECTVTALDGTSCSGGGSTACVHYAFTVSSMSVYHVTDI